MKTNAQTQNPRTPGKLAMLSSWKGTALTIAAALAAGGLLDRAVKYATSEPLPEQHGNSLLITCKRQLPDEFPRRITTNKGNATGFPAFCDVVWINVSGIAGTTAPLPSVEPTDIKDQYEATLPENSMGTYTTSRGITYSFGRSGFWTLGFGN